MEKNLTAVEWLFEKVTTLDWKNISGEEKLKIFEEAKRMETITESTSDGYHTFKELYDFRASYNAALFNEWAKQITPNPYPITSLPFADGIPKYSVHKSWKHNDGEPCFGDSGMFIVCATLPTGQISNHYNAERWNMFKIPETEKALFPFDGHTAQDVLERLKNL